MTTFKQPTTDVDPLSFVQSQKNQPGFIFLETSNARTGMSLVAADPEKEVTGSDWQLLDKELSRHAPTQKLEQGAAIGFFRYDGSFHFGFYPKVYVLPHTSCAPPLPANPFSVSFFPNMDKIHFMDLVQRAQEYIAAGDIYQVCLAHQFQGQLQGDFWNYYEALRKASPAPYSAFIRLGGTQIACTSPESFLNMDNRSIRTRPIKGTRPRHSNPERDSMLAAELLASEKERAELTMITDLERNDLGKVCIPGSVNVSDLFRLEAYPQVFHLVSTVEGRLRNDISHVQAVKACFPGGSITGAPKKRAMEIIAELESTPRGIYTGAIGFFGYNGKSQFNIVIRTAIEQQGLVSFHVGAGIVADSNPKAEWYETLHKARGLLDAAGHSNPWIK